MNTTSSQSQLQEARELNKQISTLEEQFVELFLEEGNRDQLKRIHVKLKVLKVELQLQHGITQKT